MSSQEYNSNRIYQNREIKHFSDVELKVVTKDVQEILFLQFQFEASNRTLDYTFILHTLIWLLMQVYS